MASPYPQGDAPSYASHRMSQTYDHSAPPPPPPKPNSNEISRQSTPGPLPPRPTSYYQHQTQNAADRPSPPTPGTPHLPQIQPQHVEPDPGPNWLPKILEDKSKQDLEEILRSPRLLDALAHARMTAHPSTLSSSQTVQHALSANIALSQHVSDFSKQLERHRADTGKSLLATHALERQWRGKQTEMDRALGAYSPSSLYQRLSAGVGEQEGVTRGMEENFIDGGAAGEGKKGERESSEWVRRYRVERERYYGRMGRKERWDEGRVGGWR